MRSMTPAFASTPPPTDRLGTNAATGPDPRQEDRFVIFNGKDLTDRTPQIAQLDRGETFGNTFRVEDGLLKVRYDKYKTFDGQLGHTSSTNNHSRTTSWGSSTASSASRRLATLGSLGPVQQRRHTALARPAHHACATRLPHLHRSAVPRPPQRRQDRVPRHTCVALELKWCTRAHLPGNA